MYIIHYNSQEFRALFYFVKKFGINLMFPSKEKKNFFLFIFLIFLYYIKTMNRKKKK